MKLAALEQLLSDRIGLDVASIGAATLPRVVATRMHTVGITSPEEYAAFAGKNAAEWDALVGELVVPETWFDRGGVDLFEYIARWARVRLAALPGDQRLRVLCVPCSSGEEPYSLAFALDREGVPSSRCIIEGVDLARDNLLRAAAGRYGEYSFRESRSESRLRFFSEVNPGRWEVRPEFRDRVHFRAGNLLDPDFLGNEPPYDLILCRNLFIYLTADGATRAMANLERLLARDGLLVLTAAEADRLTGSHFVPDGPVSLAIFRRRLGELNPARRSEEVRPPTVKTGAARWAPTTSIAHGRGSSASDEPLLAGDTSRAKTGLDSLIEGRRLADAGDLAAARLACEASPPTAARFSLLGVIHLAAGCENDAAVAFRKALYLDPNEPEALTHLIVLSERRGDTSQATALRRRLERVEKGAAE